MDFEDTIFAVITPPGPSPRAILRLSGPESLKVARSAVKTTGGWPRYGWRDGVLRDPRHPCPLRVTVMRAPHSYTGENVVEIALPGSPAVIDSLVDILYASRADGWAVRQAEPGEFTRRAVLNGKMDLAQAEGVLGLIEAEGRAERLAALQAVRGIPGARIREVCDVAWELVGELEAALDFAAEGQCDKPIPVLVDDVRQLVAQLESILDIMRPLADRHGEIVRVVFEGKSGVGKSALFNRIVSRAASAGASMLRSEAIVSGDGDTTRDAVFSKFSAGDFHAIPVEFLLIDVAGEPDSTPQPVSGNTSETIGELPAHLVNAFRETARRHHDQADIILHVYDLTAMPDPNARCDVAPSGAEIIRIGNKADIADGADTSGVDVVVSAETENGIDGLIEQIGARLATRADRYAGAAGSVGLSSRMMADVNYALAITREGLAHLESGGGGEDVLATLLRQAILHLEDALGRRLTPDASAESILDRIFSKFCLGK